MELTLTWNLISLIPDLLLLIIFIFGFLLKNKITLSDIKNVFKKTEEDKDKKLKRLCTHCYIDTLMMDNFPITTNKQKNIIKKIFKSKTKLLGLIRNNFEQETNLIVGGATYLTEAKKVWYRCKSCSLAIKDKKDILNIEKKYKNNKNKFYKDNKKFEKYRRKYLGY